MIADCKWVSFEGKIPTWASAHALLEGWKNLFPDTSVVSYEEAQDLLRDANFAPRMFLAVEKIEPDFLLKFLSERKPGAQPLTVFLPVIGNPVYAAVSFSFLLEQAGKDINFVLVCGCEVSAKIVRKFFVDGVTYYPFVLPVISGGVVAPANHKSKLLMYAGRISHFKNVCGLIELFADYAKTRPHVSLKIIGRPDNFEWTNFKSGCYFNLAGEVFFEKLAKLQSQGVAIEYLGGFAREETLQKVLEADCFTSLSTAPEEDFGSSIWEALQLNKNVVMTKWAGYREFHGIKSVMLVEVTKQGRALTVDSQMLFRCWDNALVAASSAREESLFWRNQRLKAPFLEVDPISGIRDAAIEQFRGPEANNNDLEFYEYAESLYEAMWK